MSWYGGFVPYVSVAERRRQATEKMKSLKKKGMTISPVEIDGRTIARTFWGKAWCENLESYSDFENRLSRGRTYVRNGSVVHLDIKKGQVEAYVAGSELYSVKIQIDAVKITLWKTIKKQCSGQIDSLVELLSGRFSNSVMKVMTTKKTGLFPEPRQISLSCSCPDGARMCKHVAATLYGVGTRLDESPELLFKLRKVNHMDLVTEAGAGNSIQSSRGKKDKLKGKDLSSLFGVEIVEKPLVKNKVKKKIKKKVKKKVSKKVTKKKKINAKKSIKKKVINRRKKKRGK